jgi:hypothetical protein
LFGGFWLLSELEIFGALRASLRSAARATSDAAGACSVSFNVAALLSKTVIIPAGLLLCFISGRASPGHIGRDRAPRSEEMPRKERYSSRERPKAALAQRQKIQSCGNKTSAQDHASDTQKAPLNDNPLKPGDTAGIRSG